MPSIYSVKIEGDESDSQPELPEGAAGAALFSDDKGTRVSYYLAIRKNEEWIPIRHPIEDSDLKSAGETFESAARKGILWNMNPMVCLDCGGIFHKPSLRYETPHSCLALVLIGLITSLLVYFHYALNLFLSIFIGFQTTMTLYLIMMYVNEFIGKRKYSERIKEFSISECTKCSSAKIKTVESLCFKTVVLKDGRKLSVEVAGRS